MRSCSDGKAHGLKSECVIAGASLSAHVQIEFAALIKRGRGGGGLTKDSSWSSRLLVGPRPIRIHPKLA